MRVAIYAIEGGRRGRMIAQACLEGVRRLGWHAEVHREFDRVRADLVVAYGWVHEPVFSKYRQAGGQFVFWDLGYWSRGSITAAPEDIGHHRCAVNSWDTLDHVRTARGYPQDRLARSRIKFHPRREAAETDAYLVAGMSDKAAGTHGHVPGAWEASAVADIRERAPGARIILRQKPGKRLRLPPIDEVLASGVKLLVTHHSNVALDALRLGVPCHAVKGLGVLASPAGPPNLVDPPFPSSAERVQLFADAAYAQWSLPEMASGEAWEYLRRFVDA